MEYQGKLYGKIGGKHFDTGKTSEDWDTMENRIKELEMQVENYDFMHSVSDSKPFDIHNCLNNIEKIVKENTSGWMFASGSIRYQIKRAIDKMLCSR